LYSSFSKKTLTLNCLWFIVRAVALEVFNLHAPNQVEQKLLTIHETVEKLDHFGHVYLIYGLTQWFSNFSSRWPPIKVYNFL